MSEPGPCAIEIAWNRAGACAKDVTYFVGGAPVGMGDAGFDRVLDLVGTAVATRIVLRIKDGPPGGSDIAGATPFAARFGELREAAGDRQIILRFD